MIGIRRHLHHHLELSFHEYQTSAFIGSQLEALKILYIKMDSTELVDIIEREKLSKTVVALVQILLVLRRLFYYAEQRNKVL